MRNGVHKRPLINEALPLAAARAKELLTEEDFCRPPAKAQAAYDRAGFGHALEETGTKIRLNLRKTAIELEKGTQWSELDDITEATLREDIRESVTTAAGAPWDPPDRRWDRLMKDHAAKNAADPFKEYLLSLGPWDDSLDVPDLTCASGMVLDPSVSEELRHWALWAPLRAAVYRTMTQGNCAPIREMLVLYGPQGTGKSATYKMAIPERHRNEWHRDSVSVTGDDKKTGESIAGAVLAEIPEIDKLRTQETGHLKTFLTSRALSYRLPYDKYPTTVPITCGIWATSNSERPVRSDGYGGNTRIVAVRVTSQRPARDMADALDEWWSDEMRAQVWRYAKHTCSQARLPAALREEAASLIAQAEWRPHIAQLIAEWASDPANHGPAKGGLDIVSIANAAQVSTDGAITPKDVHRVTAQHIRAGLKDAGWSESPKSRTERQRVWRPPQLPQSNTAHGKHQPAQPDSD